jgi:hypothetical protein
VGLCQAEELRVGLCSAPCVEGEGMAYKWVWWKNFATELTAGQAHWKQKWSMESKPRFSVFRVQGRQ